MGFHDIANILVNIEQKDKSKLLEIEQNLLNDLNEIRRVNDVSIN